MINAAYSELRTIALAAWPTLPSSQLLRANQAERIDLATALSNQTISLPLATLDLQKVESAGWGMDNITFEVDAEFGILTPIASGDSLADAITYCEQLREALLTASPTTFQLLAASPTVNASAETPAAKTLADHLLSASYARLTVRILVGENLA